MQTVRHTLRSHRTATPWSTPHASGGTVAAGPAADDDNADALARPAVDGRGFAAMRLACLASGGLARGDDLECWLADIHVADLAALGERLADGRVGAFAWRHVLWVPMFQFEMRDLSLRPAVLDVRIALGGALDGWQQARWFVRPHPSLCARTPLDLLRSNLPRVLEQAVTDGAAAAAA